MKFKNIKLSSVVTISILMLSFPLYKALSSEGNKLLIFLDALTITSMVMILLGVLYYNYLKGDFDESRYVMFRQRSGKEVDFDKYIKDKQTEKEDSFNYPLFLGIVYFIVAFLGSFFY